MVNAVRSLYPLLNILSLFWNFFSCLHVEDTVKIELNIVRIGNFLKVCCDDFCSFLSYDTRTKIYLIVKGNIILYNCKNVIKAYYSSDGIFHFAHSVSVKNDEVIEIIDPFEREKRKFTFWKPLFEFLETLEGQKYIYMPLGYYEIEKRTDVHLQRVNNYSLAKRGNDLHNAEHVTMERERQICYHLEANKNDNINAVVTEGSSLNDASISDIRDNSKKGNHRQCAKINFNTEKRSRVDSLINTFIEFILEIKKEKNSSFFDSAKKLSTQDDEPINCILNGVRSISSRSARHEHSLVYNKTFHFLQEVLIHNPIFLFLLEDSSNWNSTVEKGKTSSDIYHANIKKGNTYVPQNNYKARLIGIVILLFSILIIVIHIFLRKKKCEMKDGDNVQKEVLKNGEKRLAEIHVEYMNKIQTNFGSKIKDITDEDLINLIALNKAETIVVCQP
ncbi:conserved Plasmodium protein, unknown function [Plasmodium ovale]|uniref:Uncharacterized protein n=2 Tax=Plasmodium ovale TaxID=36330 RepID=A0A1A8VV74_PLAOA|nr:conserved Plasmodium protein, unknown function [Plasmodium ovale curtisi]SBS87670.1 conserved Plasmodium protein, unknown function [Plasmodium ovale curtisi]SCP04079.1 conserved Plasmodium protein, unknown function [Plasmodium ovale]